MVANLFLLSTGTRKEERTTARGGEEKKIKENKTREEGFYTIDLVAPQWCQSSF